MLKPAQLRTCIEAANPDLLNNPDRLAIFLDAGQVACTGAGSLSYEYRYTLNVIVQDYSHHADRIILPMLAYLRTQQPELFENLEKASSVIRFEADLLNQDTLDLSLKVDLAERVIVKTVSADRFSARHVPEPAHPQFPDHSVTVEVVDSQTDETIGSYTVPAWLPSGFDYV